MANKPGQFTKEVKETKDEAFRAGKREGFYLGFLFGICALGFFVLVF